MVIGISQQISQKFHKSVSYRTVGNWAKDEGWQNLWEEAVKRGVTNALGKEENEKDVEKTQEEKTQEEKLKELIIKAKQNNFIRNESLKQKAYKFIKDADFINITEAIRVYEVASKNTSDDIEGIPQDGENGTVVIIKKTS